MAKHLSNTQQIAQKLIKESAFTLCEGITLRVCSATEKPVTIISISKKTAPKATARNRVKRQLRTLLRTTIPVERKNKSNLFVSVKCCPLTKDMLKVAKETLSGLLTEFPV